MLTSSTFPCAHFVFNLFSLPRKNDKERQRIVDFGGLSFSFGGEGLNVAQLIGMLMHPEADSDDDDMSE